MTADERIESLISKFGQTISDLPTPQDMRKCGYVPHLFRVESAAVEWFDPNHFLEADISLPAYICHLADVIDRMEAALDTAVRVLSNCHYCAYMLDGDYECKGIRSDGGCFSLADAYLHDMTIEVTENNE